MNTDKQTHTPEAIDWAFCAASLAEVRHAAYMAGMIVDRLKRDERSSVSEANDWICRTLVSADAAMLAAGLATVARPSALPALIEAAEYAVRLLDSYDPLGVAEGDVLYDLRAALAAVRGQS